MRTIKLSILMPAFNVAAYIDQAIVSILDQTFSEFELIIVNDGSTDSTEAIVRSYHDPRIILINQSNKGIAASLNLGLRSAKAEYIARFDADDICYPERLRKQYEFMISHPDYIIIGSTADYIDENGDYVFTNELPAYSNEAIKDICKKHCPFIHSSVMYKKQLAIHLGGYNEHAHSFEDHLLWRSVLQNGKAINFPEPLIQVRLNANSITIDEQWRPKQFHQIKNKVLEENCITAEQGEQLRQIIQSQNTARVKESAYHTLLAKKYLWNNYQPCKARTNLGKVIVKNKMHWKSYCFYALSFLPKQVLLDGYKLFKRQPFPVPPQPNIHAR